MRYPTPPPDGRYTGRPTQLAEGSPGRPPQPDSAGAAVADPAAAHRADLPPDGWHTHRSWKRTHRTIAGRRVPSCIEGEWSARTYCGHRVPTDAQPAPEPSESTCGPCWTATPDEDTDYWTVMVRIPGSSVAQRLAPGWRLTSRRVHAALISTRSRALRIAAEIIADPKQPGVTAWAARF